MKTEKLDLSERIERRLEIIHAHTKQGKQSDVLSKCSVYPLVPTITGITDMRGRGFLAYSILKRVPKPLIIKPATMLHPSSSRPLIAIQS